MQIDINLVFFLMAFLILFLVIVLILVASWAIYNWQRRKSGPAQLPQPKAKSSQSTTQLSQPNRVATPIYLDKEEMKPIKIVLGEIDNPLGEIKRYQNTGLDSYEEIQIDKRALIGVSGWFQQAPNLAQSGVQMALNTYTLTFKPEIAQGLADGSLKMMKSLDGGIRAIAVDGKNVMQGAGSLSPVTGLKAVASVAAVWQVLSVVTAQKFLADINTQLAKINKKLEGIKNFLENQQDARLISRLKYLQDIHDTLSSQSFENLELGVFLNKLEDIELNCTEIMATLKLQMEGVRVASEEQPLGANFNIQDNFIEFKDLITDYEQSARRYLIAVAVKCLAYQTRLALPSNHDLTLKRLSNVQTELSIWDNHQRNFYGLVGYRLPELTSRFNLLDDEEEKQIQLKQVIDGSKNSLTRMGQDIQKLVLETENNIRNQIQETSQPVSLLVELNENGQIIKTWKLRNKNNKPVEIFEKEIVLPEKVIEDAPLEKELNQNNLCPECGLPFKTPELVQEHRERWEH